MGEHAKLRALSAERIVWPEAAGIASTPGVLDGEPCIAGTRIAVASIGFALWDYQPREGEEVGTIRAEYPHLTEEQARAALDYLEAHGDVLTGHAWRAWLDADDRLPDAASRAEFLADIRALLAERDQLRAALTAYAVPDHWSRLAAVGGTVGYLWRGDGRAAWATAAAALAGETAQGGAR